MIKALHSRNLVFCVWPWHSTWTITEWQSCQQKKIRWVTESEETSVWSQQGAETHCHPPGHFAWQWAVSALTHSLLYCCCALYNAPPLGFHQWQTCADRVVNLNMTIRFPQIWSIGELELGSGPASAHMCKPCILAEILAIVESLSWMTARSVAVFFSYFTKIQKKQRPHQRLFQGSHPRLYITAQHSLLFSNIYV